MKGQSELLEPIAILYALHKHYCWAFFDIRMKYMRVRQLGPHVTKVSLADTKSPLSLEGVRSSGGKAARNYETIIAKLR